MLNVGKLYKIEKYFWLLYPSKDIAARHATAGTATTTVVATTTAACAAAYWSKQFNCNLTYISPKTILFPVEIDGNYAKVISTEGVGWMIYPESEPWTKGCIEEVTEHA